jgi:uncharacterized membrane protein YfcA
MNIPDVYLVALPLLFIVAALYSSVGHGGASGYWAVFGLLGLATAPLVPVVLVMNILVASISFIHFRKVGQFQFRRFLPFVVSSIPAAFLGGVWKVSDTIFPLLLGIALLCAGLRIIGVQPKPSERELSGKHLWLFALPIGFVLGLVSGMIGIGGGVFLSPILIYLGLTDTKGSAAMSSAFIVVNSISGLAGQAPHVTLAPAIFVLLVAVGIGGGFVGANWGALRAKTRRLQYVLGTVLVLASMKLLSTGIGSFWH